MKALETGRQLFSWFCTDAIDEPLNKYQLLARQIFRIIYGILCIALIIVMNANLFLNYNITSMTNDINEHFYGFFQLNSTMHSLSVVVATFISGSKLASLFITLQNIYDTCKSLLHLVVKNQ